jgi:hypothetical protein
MDLQADSDIADKIANPLPVAPLVAPAQQNFVQLVAAIPIDQECANWYWGCHSGPLSLTPVHVGSFVVDSCRGIHSSPMQQVSVWVLLQPPCGWFSQAIGHVLVPLFVTLSSFSFFFLCCHWRCVVPSHHRLWCWAFIGGFGGEILQHIFGLRLSAPSSHNPRGVVDWWRWHCKLSVIACCLCLCIWRCSCSLRRMLCWLDWFIAEHCCCHLVQEWRWCPSI